MTGIITIAIMVLAVISSIALLGSAFYIITMPMDVIREPDEHEEGV